MVPVEDTACAFLLKRVYLTAESNKLAKMNIRTNIREEVYRVLGSTPTSDSKAVNS